MDRSLQKVKKIITALPGVETIKTYRLSESAIREIGVTFPKCQVESDLTMLRLLDIMRQNGNEYLMVDEEQMGEIVQTISRCLTQKEIRGTGEQPALMQWVLGSIAGEGASVQAGSQHSRIIRNIGEYMGTDADRAKNLSPNEFLARSGNVKEFQKKLSKQGGLIDQQTLLAAIASQNNKAYRWVKENLVNRGIPSIMSSRIPHRYDDLGFSLVVSAFYGSEAAVADTLSAVLERGQTDVEYAENMVGCALTAASTTCQSKIIEQILRAIPEEIKQPVLDEVAEQENYEACIADDFFTNSANRFPVKAGELTEMLTTWYRYVPNDSQLYEAPVYIFAALQDGMRLYNVKLNAKNMVKFIRKHGGPNDEPGSMIINFLRDEILDIANNWGPPITKHPLSYFKPILELFPDGGNWTIRFPVARPAMEETREEAINRGFRFPDGYDEFLQSKEYILTPDYR